MLRLLKAMLILLFIVQLFLLLSNDDSYTQLIYISQLLYLLIPIWALIGIKNRGVQKSAFQIYVIICGLYYVFFALLLMAKRVEITSYFAVNMFVKSVLLMIGLVTIYQCKNWSRLFFKYINQKRIKV